MKLLPLLARDDSGARQTILGERLPPCEANQDRWAKNPVNVVSFDNVVIAKEYSGPSK
ncbi:MAG: hypothetical protein ABGZ49_14525 [Akkermansiaceae bacterium]